MPLSSVATEVLWGSRVKKTIPVKSCSSSLNTPQWDWRHASGCSCCGEINLSFALFEKWGKSGGRRDTRGQTSVALV